VQVGDDTLSLHRATRVCARKSYGVAKINDGMDDASSLSAGWQHGGFFQADSKLGEESEEPRSHVKQPGRTMAWKLWATLKF